MRFLFSIVLLAFCDIIASDDGIMKPSIVSITDDSTPTPTPSPTLSQFNVAVLVIGEHRIYDGTWPSHERLLYEPIRRHPSTKQLDVFVCQKKGEGLPKHMPSPTASFNIDPSNGQVANTQSITLLEH
jgi:hypothetical protein